MPLTIQDEQDRLALLMKETPLLWAGHISLSADGGKSIYGFQCVVPDGYSVDDVTKQLCDHRPLPGLVTEDSELFATAQRMAQTEGWNTAVSVNYKLVFSHAKLQRVHAKLVELSQITDGSHGYKYCFPTQQPDPITGSHFPDERTANCATFPEMCFGIRVPTRCGNLRMYMPEVRAAANAKGFALLRASSVGSLTRCTSDRLHS